MARRSATYRAGASSLRSAATVAAPARANAWTMSTRWPAQVKRTRGTAGKRTDPAPRLRAMRRPVEPRTAIVTGATGQDGYYLVRRLLADGWTVHAAVRDLEAAEA